MTKLTVSFATSANTLKKALIIQLNRKIPRRLRSNTRLGKTSDSRNNRGGN
jgi:hypothetical protein